ncbi:DNA-binding transcriptional LysR family regulator [Kibdelosporangium banguiense]|uniref:DNA-binding transcriptional LysR family regulator n=1 Tax=Kibdelosporangium banguiense TaxID=1365924 RepID=A0ABS4TS00_9PSEU|nr:LysR substrate-binding domain-containing protein [Kibdelosporangium banguiense]MBP2327190.1 DNA-binding transcriptional LysR family regulator [Kibdelosporangium banguiense]
MYDVRRLRLLRELSYRGTLAAVAEALGLNPSSVSHQLTVLEREVGVRLLEPAGRGVRLTAAAQVLVEHTEAILLELERAEAAIAATHTEVSGVVRLATFQTAAHALMPAAVANLATSYPRLDIELTHIDAEHALSALVARDFDLVLHEEYPGAPVPPVTGVTVEQLATDPMLLATPADADVTTIEQTAGQPWAMEPADTRAGTWARAVCRAAGFEPQVRYESSDVPLHRHLVRHGLATALLPRLALTAEEPGIRLSALPDAPQRAIMLAFRTGSRTNPAITAVINVLKADTTSA